MALNVPVKAHQSNAIVQLESATRPRLTIEMHGIQVGPPSAGAPGYSSSLQPKTSVDGLVRTLRNQANQERCVDFSWCMWHEGTNEVVTLSIWLAGRDAIPLDLWLRQLVWRDATPLTFGLKMRSSL